MPIKLLCLIKVKSLSKALIPNCCCNRVATPSFGRCNNKKNNHDLHSYFFVELTFITGTHFALFSYRGDWPIAKAYYLARALYTKLQLFRGPKAFCAEI